MSWTEERVEALKKLWAKGLSAGEIASQIEGVTRNAVIGKVHRLNLTGRAKPAPKRARTSAPPIPRRKKSDGGSLANKIQRGTFAKPPRPQPPPEPVHVPHAGPRYGILDDRLEHLMCRAIVEGEGIHTVFCSAPCVEDSPFRFCRDHAAVYLTAPRSSGWSQERRDKTGHVLRGVPPARDGRRAA